MANRNLCASVVFAHLLPGQMQVLSGRRWVWGRSVYVAGLRLDDGELLVIISSDSPKTMIVDYGARWGIETLFGMFKTSGATPLRLALEWVFPQLGNAHQERGFCLESTHFTDPKRLSKLVALMAIALCWAVKTGEWLHQHQPIKIKKHARQAKSIFRYGLDYLRSILTDLD